MADRGTQRMPRRAGARDGFLGAATRRVRDAEARIADAAGVAAATRPLHSPQMSSRNALSMAAVLVAGCLLQAPWLCLPFGFLEENAGFFYGPFAQSYERFGFWALRGAPMGPFEVWPLDPSGGYFYFNHPPGTFWLCSALGTAEWQIRLFPCLALLASGALWTLLLRPRLGPWPAAAAGIALQAFPVAAFGSLVSLEPFVLATGLLLWWGATAARDGLGSRRWTAVAACVGPWMDWSFGFYVLALPLLRPHRGLGAAWAGVRMPWIVSLASLSGVFAWMSWAKAATLAGSHGHSEGLVEMLQRALQARTAIGDFVTGAGAQLADGFTGFGGLAALLGFAFGLRSCRRLAVVALVPAALHVLAFSNHAATHLMFWCYFAVPASLGVGALVGACGSSPRFSWLAPLVFLAAMAEPLRASLRHKQSATVPLLRDLGATLATEARAARSDLAEPTMVATNAFRSYPYYVASSKVYLGPVTDPAIVENAQKGGGKIQFVYVAAELEAADGTVAPLAAPALLAWLERFPKRELSHLRGRWPFGKDGFAIVRDAWVFEL